MAKRVISVLVKFRYLRFKLLKYKESNKNIYYTFGHNFRHAFMYNELGIIRKALFCITV